jgi:hypothetical protein
MHDEDTNGGGPDEIVICALSAEPVAAELAQKIEFRMLSMPALVP